MEELTITEKIIIRRTTRMFEQGIWGWIKNDYARTKEGNPIGWHRPKAACFCVFGGLQRSALDLGLSIDDAEDIAEDIFGKVRVNLIDMNDDIDTTVGKVVRTLREAVR